MSVIIPMRELDQRAQVLTENIATNPAIIDDLETLWNRDFPRPFIMKLLRQGEIRWGLRVFIGEQDKITSHLTNPIHTWFRKYTTVAV